MIGGLTFTIGVRVHIHQPSLRLVGIAVEPLLGGTAICSATAFTPLSDRFPTHLRTSLVTKDMLVVKSL